MVNHRTASALRTSIERDLQTSSVTGAPPLGHLVGLHRLSEPDGGYALALDPDRAAMVGGAGLLEVAMLADLALGGVIRNRVGLAVQMPTISMTIQLTPHRVSEVASADGELTAEVGRTASARSRLSTAAGEIVGDAVGVFALPRLPYTGPGRSMPWDVVGEEITDETKEFDDTVVEDIAAHAEGSPTVAWGTSHVVQRLVTTGDRREFAPDPVMANRLGHVQGGALFTAAVLAAAGKGGFSADSLATGTIAFLEPVRQREMINAEVTVIKSSGRSLFADVRLQQDDRTCCTVSTVFRR